MENKANKWIVQFKPRSESPYLLFCFHYAGGNAAAFRGWANQFEGVADVLAIQLPGRLTRFEEPLVRDMPTIISQAFQAVRDAIDRPFYFFGHSMGGLIAYEVARKLVESESRRPEGLIIASRVAPDRSPLIEKVSHLNDEEFIETMAATYGEDSGLHVLEDPDIRAMFLPVIRADMEAYEKYSPNLGGPFDFPIHVSFGDCDTSVTEKDMLSWERFSSKSISAKKVSGGHFFWTKSEYLMTDQIKHFINVTKNGINNG